LADRDDRNVGGVGGTNGNHKRKGNNQGKELLVTRESFCAVFALFTALAFLILLTGDSVFGEPGEYICDLLLGAFGYAAYPIALLACYNCVMGFIGKRIFKKRGTVAIIAVTAVLALMIAHTVQTYFGFQWTNEGYLAACFNGGAEFATTTVFGWVGALPVYLLATLTTHIGALVILSALTCLGVYLSIRLMLKNINSHEKPQRAQTQVSAAQVDPVYPSQSENRRAMPQRTEYSAPQTPVEPMPGYPQGGAVTPQNMGGYTPNAPSVPYTVRQRPGFVIQDGAYSQQQNEPSKEQTARTNTPAKSNVSGYSPFGTSNALQQPQQPLSPEETRQIIFGGSPRQNYQDNLIFDNNANVNKRPIGTSPTPTPVTYSEEYQRSVQASEPVRPQKIVSESGENFGRRPSQNPYGLDVSPSPATSERPFERETFRDLPSRAEPQQTQATPLRMPNENSAPTREDTLRNSSFERSQRNEFIEPERTERNAREMPSIDEGRGTGRERLEMPSRESFYERREENPPVENSGRGRMGGETLLPEGKPTEETPTPTAESGRRHEYMDTFSLSNPNIFGRTGNRLGERNDEDEDRQDRSMIFEDEPSTSQTRATEEDPYTLQTYDEPRGRESARRMPPQEEEMPSGRIQSESRSARMEEEPMNRLSATERIAPVERNAPMERSAPAPTPPTPPTPPPQKVEVQIEVKQEPAPAPPPPPPKPRIHKPYVRVPLHYFNCSETMPDSDAAEVEDIKTRIVETLEDYNVSGSKVTSVTFGPTVTRYNVTLPRGTSHKKVVSLEQEIAMGLCREGVNVYMNVEDGAVSIEVPNRKRQTVELGSMFIDDEYTKAKSTSLVFAMGKDIANRKVYGDVCKMTHLLVAGSSGSGKSVFLGCLIISLITKYSPDELRLILIDPKKTEFVLYNNLPHLMINEIITDHKKAVQSLSWAIGEMERRYSLIEQKTLSGTFVVNIDEYNANLEEGEEKLPKIVIIVDELADLMLNAKKDMEDKIQSLTQKARAAGIHLILATQRPSTDVITGVIKSNLPTRIAFTVATDVDSRVILDQSGAQKLLGKGDMVYTASGINTPVRVQSPFISSSDSQKVVNFIKENNEAFFDEAVTSFINNARSGGVEGDDASVGEVEEVYLDALRLAIQMQTASISMLQRKCSIGFNKAGKIIEWMENQGFISPYEGAKARRVLITQEEFVERFGEW